MEERRGGRGMRRGGHKVVQMSSSGRDERTPVKCSQSPQELFRSDAHKLTPIVIHS